MSEIRVTASPLTVQLNLTRKCNLDCLYCSADKFVQNEKEPELDTEEWKDLISRLKAIQVFNISFSGGEVFARDDIREILAFTAKNEFPKVRLTTNGTLITGEIARFLGKHSFYTIEVSLEGNAGSHDKLRGAGTFEEAVRGIEILINNKIIPKIRFTPLKENIRDLPDMLGILYPMGIRKMVSNPLKVTGKGKETYREIGLDSFDDIDEYYGIIESIKRKYSDIEISFPDKFYKNLPIQYRKRRGAVSGMSKQKLMPCSAARTSCCITAGGWVIPCTELFDFKGGNIRDKDIRDIWREAENFEKIRSISTVSTGEIPYCRNCEYNVFCSAGCRADAYSIFGDLLAPDPFCPYWEECQ